MRKILTLLARLAPVAAAMLVVSCASGPREIVPNAEGRYLGGRLAARINAIDEAARAFALAGRDAPYEPSVQQRAMFYLATNGDIDDAAAFAERVAAEPEAAADDERINGLAGIILAAHAIKEGRYADARDRLQKNAPNPFLQSLSFTLDVWIEDGLSGPKAAIAKLDHPSKDLFTGFSPLHRGLLADKAGDTAAARDGLEASVFGLGGPVGREAYGAFLERSGDLRSALGFYSALERAPGPGRRLAEAGVRRLDANTPSFAYANVTPSDGAAIALYTFAAALTQQISDERARASQAGFVVNVPPLDAPLVMVRLALDLDPKLEDARRLAADILGIYGDHEAAAALLISIPPISPHFEGARAEIARSYVAAGETKKAVALLIDAEKADPESRELRLSLAGLYADDGRQQDAVAELSRLIATLPQQGAPEDSWRYFLARGSAYLTLKQWPEAEGDLKRAQEIAPDEAAVLNFLGYSWAERGINLDQAFALIKRAVEAEPNSGAYVDSLGWAYFQRGDYAEAVKHLERAATLEPSDPTITEHLGDVYARLGRQVEAKFQWRRALELNPGADQKAGLEQKLSPAPVPLKPAGDAKS